MTQRADSEQHLQSQASPIDLSIRSATSAPEGATPEERFEALEKLAGDYLNEDELKTLEKAFKFASKAHEGQKRKSGEPFIIHPVEVAIILADLHMDIETLCAAILHDTVEDSSTTKEEVAQELGAAVAELVDGVTKITKLEVEDLTDEQAETFRKMLIAMSKDIRVMVIKLSDRLHNMRTLSALREDRRIFKAREHSKFMLLSLIAWASIPLNGNWRIWPFSIWNQRSLSKFRVWLPKRATNVRNTFRASLIFFVVKWKKLGLSLKLWEGQSTFIPSIRRCRKRAKVSLRFTT